MKILVTGAGGFIGSHLVEELTGNGHELRAMDLVWPDGLESGSPSVERTVGDVTDPASCRAAVSGCDGVFHLAAVVGDWGPASSYERVNVGGTETLLAAARDASVKRFVLVSSVAVHHYRGLREADEAAPRDGHINAYCLSKIAAEDLVRERSGDMEWTIVRPGVFPFGPRDRMSFYELAREIERGRAGYIGGGRALVTTAYVENLVYGMRLALEQPRAAGETFVIGDDAAVSWRELFSRFATELGAKPPWVSLPFVLAYLIAWKWEVVYRLLRIRRAPLLTRYRILLAGRDCHFVSNKARELLGYAPEVGLEEAVRRTVAWYRSCKPGSAP
ncbi:NAD-dependent epimerase/dehydratase family protein [Planctomycetota bacterium]